MSNKVMILGSGGLGKQIYEDFSNNKFNVFLVNRKIIDVEKKFIKLKNLILKTKPHYIINCIAKTGTEPCNNSSLEAIKVNSLFPLNLATLTNKLNIKLIHFSTDAVFEGKTPGKIYSENDRPFPITIYGQTKFFGEILIKNFPQVLIIRLPILFGKTQKGQIIDRLLSKLFSSEKIKVSTDVYSTPIYNKDVSNFLINLIKKNKFNFFSTKCNKVTHLSSKEYVSLFKFIMKAAIITKNEKLISAAKEKNFNSKIIKPQYLGLKSIYSRYINDIYKVGMNSKLRNYLKEIK